MVYNIILYINGVLQYFRIGTGVPT